MWLPVLLLLAQLTGVIYGSGPCKTTGRGGGTSRREQCKFPFKYKNQVFNSCTKFDDNSDKAWCSVETDANGIHIGGNKKRWGYCNLLSCQKKTYSSDEYGRQCFTVSGPSPRRTCKFPFEHNGKTYDSCTTEGLPSNVQQASWCPTEVDPITGKADVQGRKYGYCRCLSSAHRIAVGEKGGCRNVKKAGVPIALWGESGTELDGEGDKCYNRLSPFIVVPKGVNATAGLSELPFMALLGYDDRSGRVKGGTLFSCGGSLINRRYVLTAAHCMNNNNPKVVALGEHNLGKKCDCDTLPRQTEESCNEPTQIIDVDKVIVHEKYQKDSWHTSNDIALIRLAKPATLSTNVIPLCLPLNKRTAAENLGVSSLNPNSLAGKEVSVAGWGKTNNYYESKNSQLDVGASSSVLLHADIPISSNCNEAIRGASINEQKQICAGKFGYDSCNGDSGGPLVMGATWDGNIKYQLGIVSFGSSRCGRGTPGVYTNVAEYTDWIQRHLEP